MERIGSDPNQKMERLIDYSKINPLKPTGEKHPLPMFIPIFILRRRVRWICVGNERERDVNTCQIAQLARSHFHLGDSLARRAVALPAARASAHRHISANHADPMPVKWARQP